MPFKTKEDYKRYQRAYYLTHRKKRIQDTQRRRQKKGADADPGLIATLDNPRAFIAGMLRKICGLSGLALEPALYDDCIQEGLEAMFRARFEDSERRMLARVSSAMRRYISKQRNPP